MRTIGSLFAGVEGFGKGFEDAGWKTLWQIECEFDSKGQQKKKQFNAQILRKRFPNAKTINQDIRTIDPATLDRVDCITFGFPCQDLSVAGKRSGLEGRRSGLFWEACRIIEALKPSWIVAENVPGLLNSRKGRDFAAVLRELARLGYGISYAVLDSQHHDVPQRRHRVFIVGHLGDAAAQAVLSDAQGGYRDSSALDQAWRDATEQIGGLPSYARREGGSIVAPQVAATLTAGLSAGEANPPGRRREDDINLIVTHAITARTHKGGDPTSDTYVVNPKASITAGYERNYNDLEKPGGPLIIEENIRNELRIRREPPSISAQWGGKQKPWLITGDNKASMPEKPQVGNPDSGTGRTYVAGLRGEDKAHPIRSNPSNNSNPGSDPLIAVGIDANYGNGIDVDATDTLLAEEMEIRRLTPMECEILQGFPPGWTCLETELGPDGICRFSDGEPYTDSNRCKCPDSPRYRACGNAVTTKVSRWIATQITRVIEHGWKPRMSLELFG